jgi:arylsulfatase A-like enzyme
MKPTLHSLSLIALLFFAGCGEPDGGDFGDGRSIHHRLQLRPSPGLGAAVSDSPKLVGRFEAGDEEVNHSWSLAGDFDVKAFNQVVVSLTSTKQARAKLVFLRDGDRVFGVPSVPLERSVHPQVVMFELPTLRRRDLRVTEIQVVVDGLKPEYKFHSLDLVSLPIHSLLPGMDGELVSADDEARRVVGMTSYMSLEGVAPLARGAKLTLSALHADEHRFPGQRPKLTVTARDADGEVVEGSVDLEGRISAPESWAPVSLDLSPLSGDDVWIKLVMEVRGEAPGALMVEPPFVSTQDSGAPTVLLITSDTHRADVLGVANSQFEVNTPNLDALASRGVRFVDCLSSTNVTSPSHVAIMTGSPPRDTGIITNTGHMAEAALTVAERYRAHGYVTFGVASVRHLGPLGTGLGQGFDRIAAPRSKVWDAEVSLEVLESWLPDAQGRPLFAWLHLFDAHAPYGPPGEFDGRYYPEDKDPFKASASSEEGLHPRWLNGAITGLKDPDFAITQYRAEVDYLDHQLGRLLNLPRFKAGIVAFTADHGESFGGGGVWFSHVGLFPETLHVPLLLAWPDGPKGAVVESPVEHINLGRTLLDLSGFQGDDFPGQSLLGAVEGEVSTEPRFSFSANGKCAAVNHEGWQLTLNLRDHDYHGLLTRAHHQVELFRVSSDPGCLVDLVDDEPGQAALLRRSLIGWLVDTRGDSLARSGNEDADALAQLAALGYTMDVPETDDRGWFDLECSCDWCGRFDG